MYVDEDNPYQLPKPNCYALNSDCSLLRYDIYKIPTEQNAPAMCICVGVAVLLIGTSISQASVLYELAHLMSHHMLPIGIHLCI